MTKKFNGEMLQLARELRGETQGSLAARAGLTQGFLSQLERDENTISEEAVERLATELKFPTGFFYLADHNKGFGLSVVFYRKRARSLAGDINRLQAEVNIRRIMLTHLLRDIEIQTPHSIQRMGIEEREKGPDEIAAIVRADWALKLGPIDNLVTTIERAGGIVFKFPFGTKDIDAMSQWPDNLPPLFFVNTEAPNERIRFSLAHELGHIIMHRDASLTMEGEADAFASALLMPRKDIIADLSEMSINKAIQLKGHWRVSMAALIRRARDLNRISETRYTSLYRGLSSLGYRKKEPYPLRPEEPTAIGKIVEANLGMGATIQDLAMRAPVFEQDFLPRMVPKDSKMRLAM